MNLPTSIRTSAGKRHFAYVYSGGKYEARIETTPSPNTIEETRHYLGGIEFVDGNPESYNFGDGRIVYSDSVPPRPQFRLTDHLGNTVVFFEDKNLDGCITTEADTSGLAVEVLQRLWYYPFGMNMEGLSTWETAPGQAYRYNGKERDTLSGWTDFGARWGILEIGRWNGVDPLADQRAWVSPYNYVQNNPISRIDPTGALDDWYKNKDGEVIYDKKIKSQADLGKAGIEGTYLSANKYDKVVSDAIGANIINAKYGYEAFLNYFENGDLGGDYFYKIADLHYPDNAAGFMASLVNGFESVGPSIRISGMTHDWVEGAGWTRERNELEHYIGMFLVADKYGQASADMIGLGNEVRGLIVNDRQRGNIGRALTGRPTRDDEPTAFEWSDIYHNGIGIQKWKQYRNIPDMFDPTLNPGMVRPSNKL